jgi:Dyp-type peroxidase family
MRDRPGHLPSLIPANEVISKAQPSLLLEPDFGVFITGIIKNKNADQCSLLVSAIKDLNVAAKECKHEAGILTGFNPVLWEEWSNKPAATCDGIDFQSTLLDENDKFTNSEADIFIFVKSMDKKEGQQLINSVEKILSGMDIETSVIHAHKRANGRVLGGRFVDGITNPPDPTGMAHFVIRHDELAGGCFAFHQKFEINWHAINGMTTSQVNEMVGRKGLGNILPGDDDRSHIRLAHIFDKKDNNINILRQSMPYGKSGAGRAFEEGLSFLAFSRSAQVLIDILKKMVGHRKGYVSDKLLENVQGLEGGFYYIPSASELGLDEGADATQVVEQEYWNRRSKNGYMFYNSMDYLHYMGTRKYGENDAPSERVVRLAGQTFSRWRDNWYRKLIAPQVPHLENFLDDDEQKILHASVAIRKGMANKKSLERVFTVANEYTKVGDLFRIDPKELVVGVMPLLSLGLGKEVMPYLREDEELPAFMMGLNEFSAMGHVVPDHSIILKKGLGNFIAEIEALWKKASDPEQQEFFVSVIYSLQGIQAWFKNYATLARKTLEEVPSEHSDQIENLVAVASRLDKLRTEPAETFIEAVQLIYGVHCCYHLTGDSLAIGRLDQLLAPYYQKGASEEEMQEIIDCFWLKCNERVNPNNYFLADQRTYASTTVFYIGGNFCQGSAAHQWVQQITLGGYAPDDAETPKGGCNPITLMCLRASRRLPLNAPCTSLRLYPGMPDNVIEEAAKAILSGGAHPVLLNDDRVTTALENSGKAMTRASSRNFACDGCFEPMIVGATEFTFTMINLLETIELSLNQGASYNDAGPVFLRGSKLSYRSKQAKDIHNFDDFQNIFLKHLAWRTAQSYLMVFSNYGNLSKVCPSPMLSALTDGCIESGRDLTNGGAKYKMFAPLFVGFSHAIDSLFAIKKLVFDEDSAVTTLEELLQALMCDWGHGVNEPMQSLLSDETRAAERAERFQQLRNAALSLPKFGHGNEEVDELGHWLSSEIVSIAHDTLENPSGALKEVLESLAHRFSTTENPFEWHLTPGVGTFEGYVAIGYGIGASADGRRKGMPIASDCSPAVYPQDLPARPANLDPMKALQSWNHESINIGFSNGSPVDLNIPEDYHIDELIKLLKAFAASDIGANMMTITCADPDTYESAVENPEVYDLLRVRTGGWSEFYGVMMKDNKQQHMRRVFFSPGNQKQKRSE